MRHHISLLFVVLLFATLVACQRKPVFYFTEYTNEGGACVNPRQYFNPQIYTEEDCFYNVYDDYNYVKITWDGPAGRYKYWYEI